MRGNAAIVSTVLFLATLASMGEFSMAKKPGRPRTTVSTPPSKLGGGRISGGRQPNNRQQAPPVSQRRKFSDDDDDDDGEDDEIRFPGDAGEDEAAGEYELDANGEDEDDDILGPITSRGRRTALDDDDADEEEILTPLPNNKRRKGEPISRRELPPSAKNSRGAKGARSKGVPQQRINRNLHLRQPPNRQTRFDDDEYDDEDVYERPSRAGGPRRGSNMPPQRGDRRQPPSTGGKYNRGQQQQQRGGPKRGKQSGAMVPHQASQTAVAFTRGLAALRETIPDPSMMKEVALASLNAARSTTSKLSATVAREVRTMTSSQLEQVLLKATRPDDTAVKSKHVETLVGLTYQVKPQYDIYDSVLRKLWRKMTEKDWRTKLKALYLLHRYAADGSPAHAPALKARLRELRRSLDPKRKEKYFNSKQLLASDNMPETAAFRAFMSRYAHYVLLRAQCFGGMFAEISTLPPSNDSKRSSKVARPQKPITSTSLRKEHLESAAMLLKAGVACQFKEGEENENTAIAMERVASDLIGLSTAVAIALNRALKEDDLRGADPLLIKKWCEFYRDELLPQTRAVVKRTSSKLDAYGLYLPSRMGTSVSAELLQKGINLDQPTPETNATTTNDTEGESDSATAATTAESATTEIAKEEPKDEQPDQPVVSEGTKAESPSESVKVASKTPAAAAAKDRKVTTDEGEGEEDDDEYEYEDDEDEEYDDDDEEEDED